jgi:hypothetical protein
MASEQRTPVEPCIFCLKVPERWPAEEHIFPESLGCPPGFVLRDAEVCTPCNNRLSKADSKLIEVMSPFRPLGPFKTKKGKWQRADLANATFQRTGTNALKLELHKRPMVRGEGVDDFSIEKLPTHVRVHMTMRQRMDGRLSRGVHKIAFESLCLMRGRAATLAASLDSVRNYVLGTAGGFRHVLALTEAQRSQSAELHGVHRVVEEDGVSPIVHMSLCGMPLLVSLASSAQEILDFGRTLNAAAGRLVTVTFDEQGITRLP